VAIPLTLTVRHRLRQKSVHSVAGVAASQEKAIEAVEPGKSRSNVTSRNRPETAKAARWKQ
jgi:hypothetical protein